MRLKAEFCPGGYISRERVQRHVRLIHATPTDVFELQLPTGSSRTAGLSLAAGLREALTEKLGTEAREVGASVGLSKGSANENRVSAFLYDRASGGAGFSSRLAEMEWFNDCLTRARDLLSCPEECAHGCPACVLRPDINFGGEHLDHPGGLEIAKTLLERLQLPSDMQIFGPHTELLGAPLAEWIDRRSRTGGPVSVTIYLHGAPAEWELADWPMGEVLGRLKETDVKPVIVLHNRALTDKGLNLAQKLDLHRLSVYVSFALASKLPSIGRSVALAVIGNKHGEIAIATSVTNEIILSPNWRLGEKAVLVYGCAGSLPDVKEFDSEQLVTLSKGNAKIIKIGAKLDCRAVDFGRAFWKILAAEAPLEIASIQNNGIRNAIYTNRYLLTPLTLRLLFEVVRAIPGSKKMDLNISTARVSRTETQSWTIFHAFSEDRIRQEVLQKLIPNAQIDIRDKIEIPHERSFQLHLSDGRNITILLDQGFGAWRAGGAPRYDFTDSSAGQARFLRNLDFRVEVERAREVPIVLEMDEN